MTDEVTIFYSEELRVRGKYVPKRYGNWNSSGGDPGTPDEPAEFYIDSVYDESMKDITAQLNLDDIEIIIEKVLEKYE